jgi:phosphopantothenoylcysteine decarboxylase/phosphopantothenate--cysteine ligase
MKTPRSSLRNKRVLLGICGSVAAYKSIDLIRRLRDEEASVTAVMTDASLHFITRLSVELAAGTKAYASLFDDPMAHIELPREADVMVVAPATANSVGKFAAGTADDLLGACYLAYRGPLVLAPAMNWKMYEHPAFQENLRRLTSLGATEVPPERGALACGEEGTGRMASATAVMDSIRSALMGRDLEGMRITVTAGPTREMLDEVRFLSNRSSGKMGYALARAARMRGAQVTLISGPTHLEPPQGVRLLTVENAAQMRRAVLESLGETAVLIMAAAVADFSPSGSSGGKIEKAALSSLALEPTPDILAEVGALSERPLVIGFAAEAGGGVARAERKLRDKGVDLMVYNDVTEAGAGFDVDTNRVVIIGKAGNTELPLMSKDDVSHAILDRICEVTS